MFKIGRLMTLEYGAPLTAEERSGHGFPVFGSNGEVGRHSKYLVKGPGIVVGRKGSVGKVSWSEESFWPIDTTYFVLTERENLKWLYWVLYWLPLEQLDTSTGIPGLNRNDVYDLPIFTPSDAEKKSIGNILDTLDTTIRQTEAIIEKLKQIKQGLLHDLLTRGIDANGELRPPPEIAPQFYKESALGWIPKEWDICRLAALLVGIDAGKSPDCQDIPASSDQWGVLKVGAVHPDGLKLLENKVIEDDRLKNPAYLVRNGDLLISRANTFELVGLVCHVTNHPARLMLSDKTLRLNLKSEKVVARFLFWQLQQSSVRAQIELAATGTSGSMKNISQSSIERLFVVQPSIVEQSMISDHLDGAAHRLADEVSKLSKLSSLKSALMDDLLTGRVRVTPLLREDEAHD